MNRQTLQLFKIIKMQFLHLFEIIEEQKSQLFKVNWSFTQFIICMNNIYICMKIRH